MLKMVICKIHRSSEEQRKHLTEANCRKFVSRRKRSDSLECLYVLFLQYETIM